MKKVLFSLGVVILFTTPSFAVDNPDVGSHQSSSDDFSVNSGTVASLSQQDSDNPAVRSNASSSQEFRNKSANESKPVVTNIRNQNNPDVNTSDSSYRQ